MPPSRDSDAPTPLSPLSARGSSAEWFRTDSGRDPLSPSRSGSTSQSKSNLPSFPGFDVVEELGQGGMGAVYKARQIRLKRTVALKVIREGNFTSAEDRQRFR